MEERDAESREELRGRKTGGRKEKEEEQRGREQKIAERERGKNMALASWMCKIRKELQQIPFCLKKIYNLVIDLFMTYLRSSLAAAGHVQAPLAFTAFFLISQANFPPHSAFLEPHPLFF